MRLFATVFLYIATLALVPAPSAFALTQLSMSNGGEAITLTIDVTTNLVELQGAPGLDRLVYSTKTSIAYLYPSDNPKIFKLATRPLEEEVPSAQLTPAPAGEAQPDLAVQGDLWRRHVAGVNCGHVMADTGLARQLGATLTDFARINLALAYLYNVPMAGKPCEFHSVPRAAGQATGFPVATMSHTGNSKLTHMTQVDTDKTLRPPTEAAYLTDRDRVNIILSTIPPATRSAFDANDPDFPPKMQLKALQILRMQMQSN